MSSEPEKFTKLLTGYRRMFRMVNCFHFNSSISRDVYLQYISPACSEVIPITHKGIADRREERVFDSPVLRLGFIGGVSSYKGFPDLKQVLIELYDEGKKLWRLDVFGNGTGTDAECASIKYKGKFAPDELPKVYSEMDLLVVPSLWAETFSLITLEAISFGVPVLVSGTVGARDVVAGYAPDFVFKNRSDLKRKLIEVMDCRDLLRQYNRRIMELPWQYSLDTHAEEVEKLYRTLIEK